MKQAQLAFLIVVLVWSTTPLAINWSVADGNSQMAALLRMTIGLSLTFIIMRIMGLRFINQRKAWLSYIAGSLGIYGTMSCVYFASHIVSSGLVAVFHGLIPMLAAALSWPLLSQRTPKYGILGLAIALLGLFVVFASEIQLAPSQIPWMLLIVFGVALQALGAVLIKKLSVDMHPIQQLYGTLVIVVIGFFINVFLTGQWSLSFGPRALGATLYLAIVGSIIGFYAYFSALQSLSAVQVGLITLISPVFAVILGNALNGESMPPFTLIGSLIIGAGLATYLSRVGISSGDPNARHRS